MANKHKHSSSAVEAAPQTEDLVTEAGTQDESQWEPEPAPAREVAPTPTATPLTPEENKHWQPLEVAAILTPTVIQYGLAVATAVMTGDIKPATPRSEVLVQLTDILNQGDYINDLTARAISALGEK